MTALTETASKLVGYLASAGRFAKIAPLLHAPERLITKAHIMDLGVNLKFGGAIITENKTETLKRQYDLDKSSQAEYEVAGQKFIVIRRFTGNKNVNQAVAELAVNKADREFGLL